MYTQVVFLLVACLTSQQHASVSQGWIYSDNFTCCHTEIVMCCHTEIEVADQTFHLTQSQSTDTGLTSPSTDPITPGAWQGSHWSASFEVTGMTQPGKIPSQAGFKLRPSAFMVDTLTTWPTRRSLKWPGCNHVQIRCSTLGSHHVQHPYFWLCLAHGWMLIVIVMTLKRCNSGFLLYSLLIVDNDSNDRHWKDAIQDFYCTVSSLLIMIVMTDTEKMQFRIFIVQSPHCS